MTVRRIAIYSAEQKSRPVKGQMNPLLRSVAI